MDSRPPWFYGWNIVMATMVAQGIATAVNSYSFGFFLKPIAAEFEASRTLISLGPTLVLGSQALVSPVIGRWLDAGSARYAMLWGAILLGAGVAAMGVASALWQLALITVVFIAPGCAILGPLSATKLAANWFEQRLGRALGISAAGTSLGGLAIPPLLALLIDRFGWRVALEVFGIGAAALLIPLLWIVVRDRPVELGILPDGEPGPSGATVAPRSDPWTTRTIAGTRVFWVLAVVLGLTMGSLGGVIAHLVPYALDRGLSTGMAAALMSCLAAAGIAGKLGFALVADRIDVRYALAASVLAAILATVVLWTDPSVAGVVLASAGLGLATGGLVPSWSALVADAFGRGAVGRVMGLSFLAKQPLLLAGAPFAGYVHDQTGTYTFALQAFIALLLAALAGVALLGPARGPGLQSPVQPAPRPA